MVAKFSVLSVREFCGWDTLGQILENAEPDWVRDAVVLLFKTGCRVSELTLIQDVKEKGDFVRVWMGVRKKYEKVSEVEKVKCVGHCHMRWLKGQEPKPPHPHNLREYTGWVTRPVERVRVFSFPLAERWSDLFLEAVGRYQPRCRAWVYLKVREAGEKAGVRITPHWFRAQRACQLVEEYDFGDWELLEWFDWRNLQMAHHYARLGLRKLEEKMRTR